MFDKEKMERKKRTSGGIARTDVFVCIFTNKGTGGAGPGIVIVVRLVLQLVTRRKIRETQGNMILLIIAESSSGRRSRGNFMRCEKLREVVCVR